MFVTIIKREQKSYKRMLSVLVNHFDIPMNLQEKQALPLKILMHCVKNIPDEPELFRLGFASLDI